MKCGDHMAWHVFVVLYSVNAFRVHYACNCDNDNYVVRHLHAHEWSTCRCLLALPCHVCLISWFSHVSCIVCEAMNMLVYNDYICVHVHVCIHWQK